MHKLKDNTSPHVSKPLSTSEIAFTRLVDATMALCAAERDILGFGAFDPAFDTWLCEAEAARAAVLAAADVVLMSPAPTATDRRFLSVTRNFEAMMLTDDPVQYAKIAGALLQMRWLYQVPGRGARPARATALLQAFRHQLAVLFSLPDYAPTSIMVVHNDLAMAA